MAFSQSNPRASSSRSRRSDSVTPCSTCSRPGQARQKFVLGGVQAIAVPQERQSDAGRECAHRQRDPGQHLHPAKAAIATWRAPARPASPRPRARWSAPVPSEFPPPAPQRDTGTRTPQPNASAAGKRASATMSAASGTRQRLSAGTNSQQHQPERNAQVDQHEATACAPRSCGGRCSRSPSARTMKIGRA